MWINRCDFALALAPFRRRWGTALSVILLFAAGCAITTVNGSLFLFLHQRPLPYPNDARVMYLGQDDSTRLIAMPDEQTLDNFLHLKSALTNVEKIAARLFYRSETLRHGTINEVLLGTLVTPDYFDILGVKPILGKTFSSPLETHPAPRSVVLTEELWTTRFARDPGILGDTIYLNERPHLVIGVLDDRITLPGGRWERPLYWAPLDPRDIPQPEWRSRWYSTIALLKPGVSKAQLQAELGAATQRLRELYPDLMRNRELRAYDLKEWLFGPRQRFFNLLMVAASALSLLLAINLAKLLSGAVADRSAYFAVGGALGGSRLQLLRPLLIEHSVVCIAGTLTAIPLALAYRHLLVANLADTGFVLPVFDYPVFAATAFAGTILVLVLLVVGVSAFAPDSNGRAAQASQRVVGTRSRSWFDGIALLTQVTLAVTLMVGCSLLALSLRKRASANERLPLSQLHRLQVFLPRAAFDSHAASRQALLRIRQALLEHPEVVQAALTQYTVPSENDFAYGFIDDQDTVPLRDSDSRSIRETVCERYFELVGLRIVSGRGFTRQDIESDRRLLVVSQRAASTFWPGKNPIGRRVLFNHRSDDWAEIVGVSQNLESPETNRVLPLMWRSFGTSELKVASMLFQTRTGAPLTQEILRKIVWSVNSDTHFRSETVSAFLYRGRWFEEAMARLSFLLAIVAGTVCSFGIFSILNRRVAGSLKEIAVQKALGASPGRIISGIGFRDLGWVFGGMTVGLGVSVLGVQQLFALKNLSWIELTLAPLGGMGGIALGAVLGASIPAIRAVRADTLQLLRNDG